MYFTAPGDVIQHRRRVISLIDAGSGKWRGMVVAPHALAAQLGLAVLSEGGNAFEAMGDSELTVQHRH